MGFPSPAADYAHKRLDLNDYLGVTPGDTIFVETNEGYALLSKTRKPKQGDTVLIQFCGSTQFARILGNALITSDGDSIEGDALDDAIIIGKVMFTILSLRQDDDSIV